MNRTPDQPVHRRLWLLPVVLVLLAGHGAALYLISSRMILSATVLLGVVTLVVIKHTGVLSSLRRRRSREPQ